MATARETKIETILKENFPSARLVSVSDVSGKNHGFFSEFPWQVVVELCSK